MSDTIEKVKCLIIGSGPAGYTAAIYAARANMSPVLYQGTQPGGQLTTTNEVENFPGYPDGVTGPEMMIQLENQAKRFDTDVRNGWITKVDFSGDIHKVWVNETTEIHADTIIISTGASAKYLGLDSEQKYLKLGGGVSACAVCDGFFYRGQEIVVIGGGNTAVEEALFLTNFASKVTLIHRRDEFRCEKILEDRMMKNEKIEPLYFHELVEVTGTDMPLGVEGIKVKHTKTGEITELPCKGVFVAIGHAPANELVKDQLKTHMGGYVITKPDSTSTSIPGVFAAGDLTDHIYRQAVTSAGMGCMAALEAERFLAEEK